MLNSSLALPNSPESWVGSEMDLNCSIQMVRMIQINPGVLHAACPQSPSHSAMQPSSIQFALRISSKVTAKEPFLFTTAAEPFRRAKHLRRSYHNWPKIETFSPKCLIEWFLQIIYSQRSLARERFSTSLQLLRWAKFWETLPKSMQKTRRFIRHSRSR